MAETFAHVLLILYILHALRGRYLHDPTVHVCADGFVYYDKSPSSRRVAPDVYVSFSMTHLVDGSYQVWREGKTLQRFHWAATSRIGDLP